ncbi:immunoglobulin superfamily member 10-like [Protopterus annectens]|uniref:immunoglobulin superfamily member 10-like n=1 Tax=Protopterus annectens TaxID=7888 RepID=UPI001CFB1B48|nr:immunoglobulin superfamily member 10-like [Protopterus annectens]
MKNRDTRMGYQGCLSLTAVQVCFLLLSVVCVTASSTDTCGCLQRRDFQTSASNLPNATCCLNFTGSLINHLDWDIFKEVNGLQVLDLSYCNVSDINGSVSSVTSLSALYLNHNLLEKLPWRFLENAPALTILHLENNRLSELPKSFLKDSNIRELYLDNNRLTSVPQSILRPSLTQLGLANNCLECSCSLYGDMENFLQGNVSRHMFFDHVLCHTPQHLQGRNLTDIQKSDACKGHGLTALFVCIPVLLILCAGVCYCCCCKESKMDFDLSKECQLATVERNGSRNISERHQYVPCEMTVPSENEKNVLLKNQVLLKPSVALLGSNRDLYEQVEVQIGASVESLAGSREILQKMPSVSVEEEDDLDCLGAGFSLEEERVSMSDVLQDSTDREKMYLNQATDYYNLVPGIDLDDSDNFEYENVNLS